MSLYKALHVSMWQLLRLKSTTTAHSFTLRFVSELSISTSVLELKGQKEAFHNVLPGIMDSIIASYKFKDMPAISQWITEVLDYNLKGGKLLRGLSTVMAYELMEKPENITEESLRQSRVLGWCVEMLQAHALVLDDIMDRSVTRRGVPAWYTLHDVGLGALNDSMLINGSMHHILNTQFGHMPQYLNFMDHFNEALLFISVGQYLESMTQRHKNDYGQFTLNLYNEIGKYKNSYTFKLPVSLGLLLANNNDKEMHMKVKEICHKLGRIFQMQDDFLDVFDVESGPGQLGTDIQEGKCSWLAVTALQHCNTAQKEEFNKYYGSSVPGHIERIKRLYQDLNLPEIYKTEECTRYAEVVTLANNFDNSTRASELFLKIIDLTYKRKH